ncbi:MAG TPA: serine hydrolase domain-containing protein, partial [Acidimicrobiales bacterium]
MSPGDAAAVDELRKAVDAGTTPGAVLAAGRGQHLELLEAVGWAETGTRRRPMRPDTVFDLASLTKVTATLPVILHLCRSGRLTLDTPVVEVLGRFATARAGGPADPDLGSARSAVTVEHLLTHTAGLPSHKTYWKLGMDAATMLALIETEPLEAVPGTRVSYSDLGFILLAEVAAAVASEPIDVAAGRLVFGPLGMGRTGYGPRLDEDVAATTEPGLAVGRPVGVVHDENAAVLGGVAGHAGLFSTAEDLAAYLQAWADAPD